MDDTKDFWIFLLAVALIFSVVAHFRVNQEVKHSQCFYRLVVKGNVSKEVALKTCNFIYKARHP